MANALYNTPQVEGSKVCIKLYKFKKQPAKTRKALTVADMGEGNYNSIIG